MIEIVCLIGDASIKQWFATKPNVGEYVDIIYKSKYRTFVIEKILHNTVTDNDNIPTIEILLKEI